MNKVIKKILLYVVVHLGKGFDVSLQIKEFLVDPCKAYAFQAKFVIRKK